MPASLVRMLRAAVLAAVLVVVSACGNPDPGEWQEEDGYRWRELATARGRGVGFRQIDASRTGIDFSNRVTEAQMEQNRHLVQGSGVTIGDVDGDGLPDIYLARIDGTNALYRNLGGWRFEDITEQSGTAAPDRFSTGVVFADIDGDRDLDLLVTSLGGPNVAFVNDGTGRFTEESSELGLESSRGSMTMTLADVEGDGDLDLYVGNYKTLSVQDIYEPSVRSFDRVVRRIGEDSAEVSPAFREHYRVEVREDLDLLVRRQRADQDWFYINDGQGSFSSVPHTSGRFLDEDGNPISEAPDYFVLTAKFVDVDGDLDPDLYVCADFEDPDFFWLNDGSGVFRIAPALSLRTTSNSAMALDFSDIDRDGDLDFFEADMLSSDRRRRQTQKPTHTALPKQIGVIDDRPQMMRNTLFLNRGDTTYAQIAYLAGIEASDWTWASLFLDVDLDGYEDLLLSTGHVWDVMDYDTDNRILSSNVNVPWRRERFLYPELHLPNVLFRNNGDLTFSNVASDWGFANEADVSHGLAVGDLDGDGDRDVVINRLRYPAALLRNESKAGRIAVRLVGLERNTRGIGSKVSVLGGAVPSQSEEVTAGGAYLSGSDQTLTFATADAETVTVVVDWRSGAQTRLEGLSTGREYEIVERIPTENPREGDEESSRLETNEPKDEGPLFEDVSNLIGHEHSENPYDDYQRQPLLLNALSLLGPGASWYDIDNDGDEDLIITSGAGSSLSVYFNEQTGFRPAGGLQSESQYDLTTALAVPVGDGASTLLVGQSSYEALNPRTAITLPSVIGMDLGELSTGTRGGVQSVDLVAGDTSSAGALATADYDGDGDLDLFVGGRVLPGAYPVAASSRLLLNQGSFFEMDEYNRQPLSKIGMVSSAVFSDIDGDGDPDLILAVEWGSVKLLVNQRGVFTDESVAFGLVDHRSRWNGVTTGDLNGDGLLDIIATSWGLNTKHDVSSENPLLLYYGDFDFNGSLDLLEAQFDSTSGGIYPLESLARLAPAMPRLRLRIPDFRSYADADIEEVLGPGYRESRTLEITSLDHKLFLNRGTHFEATSLPIEAQFAPAFYAGVADFDGDGFEDVFLSQNFYPTDFSTPRYDAGRGLLLRGDGSGSLSAVTGQHSGIKVYGDQRGAAFADFDLDARLDLVVSQNGAGTKLYRNVEGKPGLRIRLEGQTSNPYAIGASIRIRYADGYGPLREIHGGSGYWSLNGPVQVLGLRDEPVAVWVRWPGGEETETPIQRSSMTAGTMIRISEPTN